MHNSQFLAALAACASLAVAAPTPDVAASPLSDGFTVEQIHTGYTLKSGPVEVLKTMNKFGKTPPAELVAKVADITSAMPYWLPPTSAITARSPINSGTVSATPQQYDSEYLEPIKIAGKTFQLDFDTGSSDLWVFGSGFSGHTTYPGTGKQQSGETWQISYGDGSSASGIVYTDSVSAGATTVTSQSVEVATKASSAFTSGAADGLLGLAFDSINTCSPNLCDTFMDDAINQGLKPVFTSLLKYQATGSYDFGFINSTKYKGSITYANVDKSQGFWQFNPSGYAIGSGSTVSPGNSVMNGIVDTGTTLIYADDSIVNAYYAKVSGAQNSQNDGGWIFPCSTTLPSFTLVIGGYKAVVPGKYINYAPNGDGTCFGGIQSDDGIGFAIYGDIFIKSQFIVFDQSTPRLGFAAQA